jgi:O-antigen/teichoic acid export membrane protein
MASQEPSDLRGLKLSWVQQQRNPHLQYEILHLKRRLIKNAIVNVGRGGTAALVALVLPPVLIRHMQPATYSVWVLILQVSAYMGYLDFGLQTAVGRYIAFAEEKKDRTSRDTVFSTALAGLSIAAALGIVCLLCIAGGARFIFPNIPMALLPPMRLAILIVGISTAIGLPASAWNGVFVGLQRYEVPALTITSGRLISSLGLIVAALTGRSLVVMAFVVAGANSLCYGSQFVALRRLVPEIRFRAGLITKGAIRELSGYCFSLTVWSFSTLLVTGFDLILVGRFQFNAVAVYSSAAVLITFLGGLQTSIFSVIMPHSATLHAGGDARALGDLLLKTTRLGVIFLLLTGLPLVVFPFSIIKIWLGSRYAIEGSSILVVLVVGNMIRLLGVPYASVLVGTGQQRLILLSPLMEGVTNLIASVLLGMRFGAIGVAWGTFIGAVVGLSANIIYSLPRTRKWIDLSPAMLIGEILRVASVCMSPILLVLPFAFTATPSPSSLRDGALVMSMCICTAFGVKDIFLKRNA